MKKIIEKIRIFIGYTLTKINGVCPARFYNPNFENVEDDLI